MRLNTVFLISSKWRFAISIALSLAVLSGGILTTAIWEHSRDIETYIPLTDDEAKKCEAIMKEAHHACDLFFKERATDFILPSECVQAYSAPALGKWLSQRCEQSPPEVLGSYGRLPELGEFAIAVLAAALGIFLLITSGNLVVREQSTGWCRIALLIAFASSAISLLIGIFSAYRIDEESIAVSVSIALLPFPSALLVVLGGRSIIQWVLAGFKQDLRTNDHMFATQGDGQAEGFAFAQMNETIGSAPPDAFPTTGRQEHTAPSPQFARSPHAQERSSGVYTSGVGGWLLLLVFGLMFLGPLFSVTRQYADLQFAADQFPAIGTQVQWSSYKHAIWIVMAVIVAFSISAGYRLWKVHEPNSVRFAVLALWVINPLAYAAKMLVGVFIFDFSITRVVTHQMIGELIGACVVAAMWTAYLLRSRRVSNTYQMWRR